MNTAIRPGQTTEAVLAYVEHRALGLPATGSGLAHAMASFPGAAMPGGSLIEGWLGQQALRYGLMYMKHFIANAKAAIAANHQTPMPDSETADEGEPSRSTVAEKPTKCPFKRVIRATAHVFEQSAIDAAAEWYGSIVTPETGAALSSLFKRGDNAARPRAAVMKEPHSSLWTLPALQPAVALS